jgi:hypothetical protein
MADNEGRADIAITSRADARTYAKHGYYHNFGGACGYAPDRTGYPFRGVTPHVQMQRIG